MDYETFIKETVHNDCFKIINVEGDNKCFYHAILNNMLHCSNVDQIKNPVDFIKRKSFRVRNNIEDFPFVSNQFCESARMGLEARTVAWLNSHRNDIYPELGLKISELIEMTHEIPFEHYIRRDFDEYPIWGGLPEQVAIANLYQVPISIYRPVRYNKKTKKICEGIIKIDVPNKDVRFQQVQVIKPFGALAMPTTTKGHPIQFRLLWKRYSDGNDHYMSLFHIS